MNEILKKEIDTTMQSKMAIYHISGKYYQNRRYCMANIDSIIMPIHDVKLKLTNNYTIAYTKDKYVLDTQKRKIKLVEKISEERENLSVFYRLFVFTVGTIQYMIYEDRPYNVEEMNENINYFKNDMKNAIEVFESMLLRLFDEDTVEY